MSTKIKKGWKAHHVMDELNISEKELILFLHNNGIHLSDGFAGEINKDAAKLLQDNYKNLRNLEKVDEDKHTFCKVFEGEVDLKGSTITYHPIDNRCISGLNNSLINYFQYHIDVRTQNLIFIEKRLSEKEFLIKEKYFSKDHILNGAFEKYFDNFMLFTIFRTENKNKRSSRIRDIRTKYYKEYKNKYQPSPPFDNSDLEWMGDNDLVRHEDSEEWRPASFAELNASTESEIRAEEQFEFYLESTDFDDLASKVLDSDRDFNKDLFKYFILSKNHPRIIGNYKNNLKEGSWTYFSSVFFHQPASFIGPIKKMIYREPILRKNGKKIIITRRSRYSDSNSFIRTINADKKKDNSFRNAYIFNVEYENDKLKSGTLKIYDRYEQVYDEFEINPDCDLELALYVFNSTNHPQWTRLTRMRYKDFRRYKFMIRNMLCCENDYAVKKED